MNVNVNIEYKEKDIVSFFLSIYFYRWRTLIILTMLFSTILYFMKITTNIFQILIALLIILLIILPVSRVLQALNRSKEWIGKVEYVFNEKGIVCTRNDNTTVYEWSEIRRIRIFRKKYTLSIINNRGLILLPITKEFKDEYKVLFRFLSNNDNLLTKIKDTRIIKKHD